MLGFLKHKGIQVLLLISCYLVFANSLPLIWHQGFYTVSLFIKDLLMWIMPFVVAMFIAHTIQFFEKKAPLFILTIMVFEAVSNMCAVWYGFSCGHLVADHLPSFMVQNQAVYFKEIWRMPFSIPAWWSADKGVIVGLVLGSINAFYPQTFLKNFVEHGKKIAEWTLARGFSQVIPLFILGFIAHMYQTKLLDHVVTHYAFFVMWLVIFISFYLYFLFFLGSGNSLSKTLSHMANLLPAGGIALTSGSSLFTMPWTISGAAKNLENPELAKAIIPATTNIQQIGDCITNSFLCFLIYKHFYGVNPDISIWIGFSIIFVLARFATAAVMGGAIFLMLPIYEKYLKFTPDMIALILAFNAILDPLVTTTNVMINGALCRVFESVWGMVEGLSFKKKQPFLKKT